MRYQLTAVQFERVFVKMQSFIITFTEYLLSIATRVFIVWKIILTSTIESQRMGLTHSRHTNRAFYRRSRRNIAIKSGLCQDSNFLHTRTALQSVQ